MGLEKAIESGKEHRVAYGTKGQPFAKSVDVTCRNHGGRPGGSAKQCYWCYKTRNYRNMKEYERIKEREKNDVDECS